MRLYSYVVARDFGFAPNPFHGWCTLATCKPKIRSAAAIGDWVVGTGAKTRYGFSGRLLYAMRIDEAFDFDAYWSDRRFVCKRPMLCGSLKQIYGDNIYHKQGAEWLQADSHHSLEGGSPNPRNIERDTSVDRVLASCHFAYFGSSAIHIPNRFRGAGSQNIVCSGRGHRVVSGSLVEGFLEWFEGIGLSGIHGMPLEFQNHQPRRKQPEQLDLFFKIG